MKQETIKLIKHSWMSGEKINLHYTLLQCYDLIKKEKNETVTYMINGLHWEVKGHKLANGSQPVEGGSHGQPGKAHFGDRRVDDPLVAVLLPQATRHL